MDAVDRHMLARNNIPLEIDQLKELLQDWVIAPRVLDASACRGDCSDPRGIAPAPLQPRRRAPGQLLAHLGNSSRLAPMSILYHHHDENTVAARNYLDMIVRACGCL
ncbi:protein dbl-1-like [Bacillus rossius redtenbacheri]|uniref:protein dbl-1-like n=1 Tax=Bacillus rossius redtenbacheri TaxID=93214 RepID=UPI002FDDFE8C